MARAGLKGVTPHTLRHTSASWMIQQGISALEVSRVLGHKNSRITEEVYAKHAPDYLGNAVSALEIGELGNPAKMKEQASCTKSSI